MSAYQIIFISILAVTALIFIIWFRSYAHKLDTVGRPDRSRRRESSLAMNGDVDSEDALENPLPLNGDVLDLLA